MTRLLPALAAALVLVAAPAGAADPTLIQVADRVATNPPEPNKCYDLVGKATTNITVGLAVDLCANSADAIQTVACFMAAGDQGLPMGLAVRLCSAKPRAEQ